ncbi:MAG: Na/Pi cotransporter family protein [Roseinatronobacter sp.]
MTYRSSQLALAALFVLLALAMLFSPDFQRIAAGIALFLLGMLMLEEGFKALGGSLLERWLTRMTGSFPRAIGFGALATSITQSSSLVSVISISFLSAGMITLQAGIGIIFGANLGTTTGAWLIAGIGLRVDIAAYALPLLALGVLLLFQSGGGLRGAGRVLVGIGLIFLGIGFIKDGFDAFSARFDLSALALGGVAGLLIYTLVGVAATVVMQSSHAAMLLVITALSAGQISYENALAVAIGANVGTTITALVGAMQANYQGKRLALGHLIFNLVTGAAALVLIVPLRMLVDTLGDGLGIAADDVALRLALFHTLFNLLGLVLMVPQRARLLRYLERRIGAPVPSVSRPRHITGDLGAFPVTVVTALQQELEHLQDNATALIATGLNLRMEDLRASRDLALTVSRAREPILLDYDQRYADKIKSLHAAILEFCAKQARDGLPESAAQRVQELREAANALVRAVKAVKHMRANTVRFTTQPQGAVTGLYDELRTSLAQILVEIDLLRRSPPEARDALVLMEERAALGAELHAVSARLEGHLQRGALSAAAAASVLNDAGYAGQGGGDLLDAAQRIFRATGKGAADIERLLSEEAPLDFADKTSAA